jgi:hypothetical protein
LGFVELEQVEDGHVMTESSGFICS